MGKHSPTVAVQKVDRMILVHLLVLVYSLGGCLGVHRSPGAVWESQDIAGRLNLLDKFSNSELVSESLAGGFLPQKHTVAHDEQDNTQNSEEQNNQIREFSLKMLLENLAKLRHLNKKESQIKVSQTVRKGGNANSQGQYTLWEKQMRTSPSQTQRLYWHELLSRYTDVLPFRHDPLRSNTWSNFISISSGDDQKQSPLSAETGNTFYYLNNILYNDLSVRRTENKDIHEGEKDFHHTLRKVNQEPRLHDYKSKKLDTDRKKSFEYAEDEGNEIRYLFTPVNYLTDKDDAESVNSLDKTLNAESSASFDRRIDQHGEVLREVNAVKSHGDVVNGGNADTVSSLIFKAVKKMEGIVKKRVYQYDTFLTTVQHLPDDGSDSMEQGNRSNDTNSGGHENRQIAPTDSTHPTEPPPPQAKLTDPEDDSVIQEVVKAVADRKVPKDIRFWKTLSEYLDSNDFRTRSRRSSEGKRHKTHRYVHLSITYGHVMPCEHRDRFYCMNGGTCVFVGALDIKTCRCPIGYTGVRCELIDQEYILSLLTNTLIFS